MHKFWNTQPMPCAHCDYIGELDSSRSAHYIRDEHFSLEYSKEFIAWATEPEWNLGLRTKNGGKLVGFISGVPSKYRIHDKVVDVLQINFLCVHDTIRNKRLAPLLISEIRRRANAIGIWQAVYTAVTELPTPITKTRYWHRLLNVPKLNKAKFSQERERPHRLVGNTSHSFITKKDVPRVARILNRHLSKYSVAPVIDEAYVTRWLISVKDVVHSYIDETTGHVTSYYCVPYTSVKTGILVKQAYMFYDTGNELNSAAILARNAGFDVYNTLDVGLKHSILRESKFMEGNGHNHCYVYNWSCGTISPENIFMRFF
jgi:glycylpeptide N-tetradecanoyltransferase